MSLFYAWPGRKHWTRMELLSSRQEPTVAEVTKAILERESSPQVQGWHYGLHLVEGRTGADFVVLDQAVPLNSCLKARWKRVRPEEHAYCQQADDVFRRPQTHEEREEEARMKQVQREVQQTWRDRRDREAKRERRHREQGQRQDKREGRTTQCRRCGELGHVELSCPLTLMVRPTGIPRSQLEVVENAQGRTQLRGEDGTLYQQRNMPEAMPARVHTQTHRTNPTHRTNVCTHADRVNPAHVRTLECCGARVCRECLHAHWGRWCDCE